MTRSVFFIILAIVLFLVVVILALTDTAISAKTHEVLLFGGLASFAAGHLP